MRRPLFWLAAACVLLPTAPAAMAQAEPETLEGEARAIDAGIIAIGNQRVILWAIDAPERDQYCIANSRKWGCCEAALRTLQNLAGRGAVKCILTGEPGPFHRRYGVCESGGVDLGAELVRAGMAWPSRSRARTTSRPAGAQ